MSALYSFAYPTETDRLLHLDISLLSRWHLIYIHRMVLPLFDHAHMINSNSNFPEPYKLQKLQDKTLRACLRMFGRYQADETQKTFIN